MKIISQPIFPTKNTVSSGFNKVTPQYSPAFGGKPQNVLSGLLEKNIDKVLQKPRFSILSKLKLQLLLNKTLPQILTDKNFINNGGNASVYKLSEKYVLKINHEKSKKSIFNFLNFIKPKDKKFNSIQNYYGSPLIIFGNMQILKNASSGISSRVCGLPYSASRPSYKEVINYEKDFIPYLASLPQESYTNLAKNLNNLNKISNNKKEYYMPDFLNPNNFLIVDNKFRIVDELIATPIECPNDFLSLVEPLLLRYSVTHLPDYKRELVDLRRTILKKCLIAAEEAGLPLENKISENDKLLKELLQKITKTQTNDLMLVLKNMREDNHPINVRIELINNSISTYHY